MLHPTLASAEEKDDERRGRERVNSHMLRAGHEGIVLSLAGWVVALSEVTIRQPCEMLSDAQRLLGQQLSLPVMLTGVHQDTAGWPPGGKAAIILQDRR